MATYTTIDGHELTLERHNYRVRVWAKHGYIGSLFKSFDVDSNKRMIRAGWADSNRAPAVDGKFKTRNAALRFLVEAALERGDLN